MPQYQITPWKYHSELIRVRRELYMLGECEPPQDLRRHAVDLIAAWRMRGSLPHAVESTALLVDAMLHQNMTKNSAFSVRATYSAAFCRFVTGFCDISQESAVKKTMFDAAREIDMPASFVELRHEATHRELPTLQRLMSYAQQGLDWLWQYFWSKLEDTAANTRHVARPEGLLSSRNSNHMHSTTEPDPAIVREIFSKFLSARKAEMKASRESFDKRSPSAQACMQVIGACKGQRDALFVVVRVLVTEKMLIPSGRHLGDSLTGATKIWDNVLRRLCLHQKRFAPVLLERMTSTVLQPSGLHIEIDTFREAIVLWILHIFASEDWKHSQIYHRVEMMREAVVKEALLHHSHWAKRLVKELVESSDETFKRSWGNVSNVYNDF